ncbi:hypothetical protein [Nocardia sp. NPDC047038]|uniref:WXG100-like domain-containing protein n=1 Tax=Nocardia sp. NPDC047038 TaxID=3154338 RepID=UPI0033E0DA10
MPSELDPDMPVEIPSEVAHFLNFIGIQYPDINEDDVRLLGQHVRVFAMNIAKTHESATGVIKDMNSVYSGDSYEALATAWGRMSATHMADLDRACKIVATALDVAADVITAVKIATLTELAALAVSYAVVLTTPGAQALGLAVREAARRLCNGVEDILVSYIAAEVVGEAIEPLGETIDRLIKAAVRDALGMPPSQQSSSVQPLYIEPDEMLRYAKILHDHANEISQHTATFVENVDRLDFTTADRFDAATTPAFSPQREIGNSPAGRVHAGIGPEPHSVPRSMLSPQGSALYATTGLRAVDANQDGPAIARLIDRQQAINESIETVATPDVTNLTRPSSTGMAVATNTSAADEYEARRPDTNDITIRCEEADKRVPKIIETQVDGSDAHIRPAENDRRELGSSPEPIASDSQSPSFDSPSPDNNAGTRSSLAQQNRDNEPTPQTPWGRRVRTPHRNPARTTPPKPTSAVADVAAGHKSGRTPWSKTTREPAAEQPVIATVVFGPTSAGPAPTRHSDKASPQKDNQVNTIDSDARPANAETKAVQPRRESAVTAPETGSPPINRVYLDGGSGSLPVVDRR